MNELQELPAGWRWSTIGEIIANAQSGFACGIRDQEGVIQLRMNNVTTNGGFVWEEFIRVPCDDESVVRYKLLPGDIVFNNTNSTELVGKSALFQEFDEDVVYSNHFTRLRVQPDKCDPAYFSYWLNHLWKSRVFENICNRWIGQSAVKPEKLFSLKIPLPPPTEQRRIAALLSEQLAAVEQARKAAEAQLEAVRALSAAYLREVFESEEAKKWKQIFLANLIEEFRYGTSNKSASKGYITLRIPNIIGNTLDLNDLKNVPIEELELERLRLINGDLLFVRTNGSPENVGRSAVFDSSIFIRQCLDPTNIIFASYLIRARLKFELILPSFLQSYLQTFSGREAILSKCKTTAGQYNINTQGLSKLLIPLPSINIQKRMIDELGKRLAAKKPLENSIATKIEYINALPSIILSQAFSGVI